MKYLDDFEKDILKALKMVSGKAKITKKRD